MIDVVGNPRLFDNLAADARARLEELQRFIESPAFATLPTVVQMAIYDGKHAMAKDLDVTRQIIARENAPWFETPQVTS